MSGDPVIIGDATLYLGDCRDLLPKLAIVADHIITDPPFDNEHNGYYGGFGLSMDDDKVVP